MNVKIAKFCKILVFLFPLSVFGIEIDSSTFIKADQGEEEEDSFELSAPNMGRVYTKEKVRFKRDLSSLDSAVESLSDPAPSLKQPKGLSKKGIRKPASHSSKPLIDYGDSEIRWGRP